MLSKSIISKEFCLLQASKVDLGVNNMLQMERELECFNTLFDAVNIWKAHIFPVECFKAHKC